MEHLDSSQLIALLENTETGVYSITEGGIIVYANASFLDLLAVTELNDIEGQPIFNWIGEKNADSYKKFIRECLKSGVTKNCETLFVANDRKKLIVEQSGVRTEIDGELCINVLARDITKRKNVETKLKEAKEKAEESNKLKTAFLANLSHEVRTPMNAIMGFSELLLSENIPASHKEKYINYINNSGAVLLNLIDDIIDIAKMQAGQLAIKKIKCDLSTLIYDLYSSYSQMTKSQKGDTVILNCVNPDTKNQIKFNTDPLRLRQIFTNLLSNALKYTDKGSITFGYNYEEVLQGKPICFFVEDTGVGLNGDNKEMIFDRFYKMEEENLKFYRGAGLGLTISKNLVNLLGGKIWVDSEVGRGSKFYFDFPLEDISVVDQGRNKVDTEIDYELLRGKTILVAEDEEINFIYIDELLKKYGTKVLHARNGQEAIDMFKQFPEIDLVLMDIKMPVLDGYEATRGIKKLRSVPIIAQTAYALAGEKDKIIDAGCDDYLSKPIKPVSLFKQLSVYLKPEKEIEHR